MKQLNNSLYFLSDLNSIFSFTFKLLKLYFENVTYFLFKRFVKMCCTSLSSCCKCNSINYILLNNYNYLYSEKLDDTRARVSVGIVLRIVDNFNSLSVQSLYIIGCFPFLLLESSTSAVKSMRPHLRLQTSLTCRFNQCKRSIRCSFEECASQMSQMCPSLLPPQAFLMPFTSDHILLKNH